MSRHTATARSFDFLGPDPLLPRSTPRPSAYRRLPRNNDRDRDVETTLTLSPEDKIRILARAFETMDDDPTLELPAPPIPDDVPSPISVPPPLEDVYGPISTPTRAFALPPPATMRGPSHRRESQADLRTHALVVGIWSVAVMMASALLAYAMQS
jgi:hypothetical protein